MQNLFVIVLSIKMFIIDVVVVDLQYTVFFDGLREFYEHWVQEVIDVLNLCYKSLSSSLVSSWRLWNDRCKYHYDAEYLF